MSDFTALHDVWMSYAVSICHDKSHASDLVQDMYVKLLTMDDVDTICNASKPNRSWVYITIRNAFIDEKRKEVVSVELPELVAENEIDIDKDESIDELFEILKELGSDDVSRYHCQHLLLYVVSGKSLRTLAKEMNTSIWIITNAIRNAKRTIRERHSRTANVNGVEQ